MTAHFVGIHRPERWSVPFGPDMTEADVERILEHPPFSRVDESRFPAMLPFRGILQNDARIWKCQPGDIIVRAGDYLGSAFYILSGNCRIELEPRETRLPAEVLGRQPTGKKNIFQLLAQIWSPWLPEVRDPNAYTSDPRVGRRDGNRQPRIFLHDVQSVLDSQRTARLEAGQSFGETAALTRTPREFTVFAETEAELVEVRWQGLRDLMRRDDGLRRHAEETFRERALHAFLTNSPALEHLKPEELQEVADAVVFESYGSYDQAKAPGTAGTVDLSSEPIIAEEGQYANGVYLVRNGTVRISVRHQHGHRTVGYLTAGQSYGIDEFLAGRDSATPATLRHSLRAVGYVNLVLVPGPIVEKYLLTPEFRQNGDAAPDRKRSKKADARIAPEFLEFVIENRFVNGSASMLINLDRCTRCDDCVRACASTHNNNPRFLRHGPVFGQYMVANACLHCQNPVCMIECPTGAIHRDLTDGMVVVNDLTCIGCSACANNCPYDAIRMVEIRDSAGEAIVDTDTNVPVVKATKCDLCFDQWGGPACERACPHDALHRLDMRDLDVFSRCLNS